MKVEPPEKQISTRKGVLLIAIILLGITAINLVRHWSQTATKEGIVVQTAEGRKTVAIFTTDSCTYCTAAKKFLDQKKVAYTEFNLNRSEKARQVFGMLGGRGVPLIIVGERRLEGFNTGMLSRLLREEGILQPK